MKILIFLISARAHTTLAHECAPRSSQVLFQINRSVILHLFIVEQPVSPAGFKCMKIMIKGNELPGSALVKGGRSGARIDHRPALPDS